MLKWSELRELFENGYSQITHTIHPIWNFRKRNIVMTAEKNLNFGQSFKPSPTHNLFTIQCHIVCLIGLVGSTSILKAALSFTATWDNFSVTRINRNATVPQFEQWCSNIINFRIINYQNKWGKIIFLGVFY